MTISITPLQIAALQVVTWPPDGQAVACACPRCAGEGCDKCSQTGLAEFCSADVANEIPNHQTSRWAMGPQGVPSGEPRGTGPCTEPAAGAVAPEERHKRGVATIHRSE